MYLMHVDGRNDILHIADTDTTFKTETFQGSYGATYDQSVEGVQRAFVYTSAAMYV